MTSGGSSSSSRPRHHHQPSSSSTALRRLLQRDRWDDALHLLRTDPDAVQSELHTDAENASRGGGGGAASSSYSSSSSKGSGGSNAAAQSPLLHLACERGAPDEVILEILTLDEGAASRRGRGGNLPLHVATRHQLGADVIEGLIRANPAALDCPNYSNVLPRHLPHPEPCSHQALRRPTACWHQLMSDEDREESQDARLASLHEKVDAALTELTASNDRYDILAERVEGLGRRLDKLEVGDGGCGDDEGEAEGGDSSRSALGAPTTALEQRFERELTSSERRLRTAEEAARLAAAREFMARAASMARRSDVGRMQRKFDDRADDLGRDVEAFRGHLEFRRKMMVETAATTTPMGGQPRMSSPTWSVRSAKSSRQ